MILRRKMNVDQIFSGNPKIKPDKEKIDIIKISVAKPKLISAPMLT